MIPWVKLSLCETCCFEKRVVERLCLRRGIPLVDCVPMWHTAKQLRLVVNHKIMHTFAWLAGLFTRHLSVFSTQSVRKMQTDCWLENPLDSQLFHTPEIEHRYQK